MPSPAIRLPNLRPRITKHALRTLGAALLALAGLAVGARAETPSPLIAAAASLRFALDEIAAGYTRQDAGRPAIRITYGATGTLVRQIEQGAPFEIFLAADDETPARIAAAGLADGPPVPFAVGRLALVAGPASTVTVDAALHGLKAALDAGTVRRFAIANPELAPYGRAAREVLQHAGLLDRLANRLVIGENVGQTAQFVASGAAQAGLVAQSLAQSGATGERLKSAAVPDDWHRPIRQDMVLLKRAGAAARAFYAHLRTPDARATLTRHGFGTP